MSSFSRKNVYGGESRESCDVDRQKLQEAMEKIGPPEASFPLLPTRESYLRALSKLPPIRNASRWVVLKNEVPGESLLTQLEQEKIFSCSRFDPNGRQEFHYNTFLILNVALFLNEPHTYILRRSCSMLYENEKIPIFPSIKEVPVVGFGDSSINVEPQIMTIRETGSLIFQYDTRQADQVNQNKFAQLVQKMREREVEVGIDCVVLRPEEVSIGAGKRFRVKTLQASP
jgi:hypothetical protein